MKTNIKHLSIFVIAAATVMACVKEEATAELTTPGASITLMTDISSPRFSVLAGVYAADQMVELSTIIEGSTIYYTLDGSEPTTASTEYVDPILVSGHGTILEIRAIASFDSGPSDETASYYKIDSHHTPSIYATDLSLAEIKEFMVGEWIGNVTTPWVEPQNVVFKFEADGAYSGRVLTATNRAVPYEFWGSALYYGTDADHASKVYNIYDIQADGKATADITIYFHVGSTNVDRLRHIAFSPSGNYLEFELWHHMTYGPVRYRLTRYEESSTAGKFEVLLSQQ